MYRIKKAIVYGATCGPLGAMRLGFMVPSLVGVAILVALLNSYMMSASFFFFIARLLVLGIIALLMAAMTILSQEDRKTVILHKMIGSMLCFGGLSMQLPELVLLGGFFLYHLITLLLQRMMPLGQYENGIVAFAMLMLPEFCVGLTINCLFHAIIMFL